MEALFTNSINEISMIILVIGILAFAVSMVTEVFKNVSVFKNIPTDLFVLILSVVITVTAFVAYMQYIQQEILWYMILAAVLAGLVVAYVAMFGWEKFTELWKRFKKGSVDDLK